jgi:D-erythronate 2-dehydrogenase
MTTGTIAVAGGEPEPIARLVLVDRVPAPADLAADPRVTAVSGELGDLLDPGPITAGLIPAGTVLTSTVLASTDVIFHLAAAVSAECEADFDLGMRVNLGGTQALLARCRDVATNPVVVFASSLAVFGGSVEHPLPRVVDDQAMPNPQSSYGVQKVIGEQLLADYTRKGYLRGRAIRLMTVSVRPGRPNAAASGFLSGIIREPLAGQRAICPVGPEAEVALTSPGRAIDALLCAAASAEAAWGGRTPVNLPALTVTVGQMVAALEQVAGPQVSALIDWIPDPAVAAIVTSWPARFRAERAGRLGLRPDPDFESVIRAYLAETRTIRTATAGGREG